MDTKHTPGPWTVFVDDTGGPNSGWPLSIDAAGDPEKMVVRTGGQWPYEWDAAMSQREAVANAYLISAAPDLLDALHETKELLRFALLSTTPEIARDAMEFIRKAESAIAKATGEAQ